MNFANPRVCDQCGREVSIYNCYSMRNHVRVCTETGDLDSEEDIVNACESDVNMVDTEEDPRPLMPGDLDASTTSNCYLNDFDHLNQYMETGRCVCTEAQLQLVKFIHMAHGGYGVSRAFSVGMLEYSKEAGGQNLHLPDSWGKCVEETTELIEALEGKRKTFTLNVAIPDNVRELLADPSQTQIQFEFECPITEMIRVAMFSKTCKSWANVALSYEDNNGYLDDFCNGDRYKQIAGSISRGGAILGAVLATDGICLDKCMFDSQEVCP
jgi:hypothetical protein